MSKTVNTAVNYLTAIDRLKTMLVSGDSSEILRAVGVPRQDFPGSVGISALDEGDHMILNFDGFQIKVSFEKVGGGAHYFHIFTLRGEVSDHTHRTHRFPLDMLRYDCCYPYDDQAVEGIAHCLEEIPDRPDYPVKVILCSTKAPSRERWATFGWTVIEVK